MIWLVFLLMGFAGTFFSLGAAVTVIRFLMLALWVALGLVLILVTFGAVNAFKNRNRRPCCLPTPRPSPTPRWPRSSGS